MIDPDKAFQLYIAAKAHFTSEQYDIFKYNGRINTNDLDERNDRGRFYTLAKKFTTADKKAVALFFVSNLAYGNEYPLEDFDKSFELYTKWNKIHQSITKVIKDDLTTLANMGTTYDDLVDASQLPKLYYLAKTDRITLETIVALNRYDPFLVRWKKQQPLWKSDFLRIQKLDRFVGIKKDKLDKLIEEFKEDIGTHHAIL